MILLTESRFSQHFKSPAWFLFPAHNLRCLYILHTSCTSVSFTGKGYFSFCVSNTVKQAETEQSLFFHWLGIWLVVYTMLIGLFNSLFLCCRPVASKVEFWVFLFGVPHVWLILLVGPDLPDPLFSSSLLPGWCSGSSNSLMQTRCAISCSLEALFSCNAGHIHLSCKQYVEKNVNGKLCFNDGK